MGERHDNNETILTFTPMSKKKRVMKITVAMMIETDNLVPFQNRPFTLYQDQLYKDMVESVRSCGVLMPIVVRPVVGTENEYEILSGHIRVEAAKEVGIKSIPAVVKKGLTDAEVLFIVAEANRVQRSFTDMAHSEKAATLATQYESMKMRPGHRSDLAQETNNSTCVPSGYGLKTIAKIGAQYGLSKNTAARYLRVNKLIPELKVRLDAGGIGMRAAEALSYLRVFEQEIVEELLDGGMKIDTAQADALKKESAKGGLDRVAIVGILSTRTS